MRPPTLCCRYITHATSLASAGQPPEGQGAGDAQERSEPRKGNGHGVERHSGAAGHGSPPTPPTHPPHPLPPTHPHTTTTIHVNWEQGLAIIIRRQAGLLVSATHERGFIISEPEPRTGRPLQACRRAHRRTLERLRPRQRSRRRRAGRCAAWPVPAGLRIRARQQRIALKYDR